MQKRSTPGKNSQCKGPGVRVVKKPRDQSERGENERRAQRDTGGRSHEGLLVIPRTLASTPSDKGTPGGFVAKK